MTDILHVVTTWQNWPGAPGYTHMFYSAGGAGVAATTQTFFDAIKAALPTGVSIQVPGSGDILDPATGLITGSWSETTPSTVTGTGVSAYAGGAGALVSWRTGGLWRNRRVRGRTFLVPITSNNFDTNGSLAGSFISTLQTAANALIAAAGNELVVWSRPGPHGAGAAFPVTTAIVPDLAVSLRSRRT